MNLITNIHPNQNTKRFIAEINLSLAINPQAEISFDAGDTPELSQAGTSASDLVFTKLCPFKGSLVELGHQAFPNTFVQIVPVLSELGQHLEVEVYLLDE